MRTVRRKYQSSIPIDENIYKSDFTISDKYMAFSSEILRLALLGLAGYGFLLANVAFKAITDVTQKQLIIYFSNNKLPLSLGAFSFILSALCALAHRFYATDCMTHYIRRLRLSIHLKELCQPASSIEGATTATFTKVEKRKIAKLKRLTIGEDQSFEKDLRTCKWLLITAGVSLLLGVSFVILSLGSTLNQIIVKVVNA